MQAPSHSPDSSAAIPVWEAAEASARVLGIRLTDRPAVRRRLSEALAGQADDPEAAVQRLAAAVRDFGLRGDLMELTVREAAAIAQRTGPVLGLVPGSERAFLVTGGRWFGVTVQRDGKKQFVRTRDLLAALRIESDQKFPWLLLTSALPCTGAASTGGQEHGGEQGHGEPGGHGKSGHGHGDHAHGGHGHGAHMGPLTRLLRLLAPEFSDIYVVAIFAAVVSVLSLASPIAVESLVNTIAFGRLVQPLLVICGMLLVFLSFAALLKLLQAYMSEIIQRRIFVRVVADLANRLPQVRGSALDGQHGPELMNRFFDVMTVQKSAALLVIDGVAIVLQTIVGMTVLAFYHPWFIGFDLFLLFLMTFVVWLLGRGAVTSAIRESRSKYAVAAWLEEMALFPAAFKASGGIDQAVQTADRLTEDYLVARKRHFRVLIRQVAFALGLQAVAGSLLLGIGGWLVMHGNLTLGQLVAAELIVAVIVGSFAKIGKHLESYYDLLAAVDKLGHLFDLPVEDRRGVELPAAPRGAQLALHEVEYHFDGGSSGLHGVSLHVAAGEVLAVMGPPGSGKSTLLDLLYGLRSPTGGHVDFDGLDLTDIRQDSLRKQVALARDADLFTGTLERNIHFDRAEVTSFEVRKLLRALGLTEELRSLPDGLNTLIQPGGKPLSESQARRVVLARALAGGPRLLLIDGLLDTLPLAALRTVLAHLRSLRSQTTTLIVTSRWDLADLCDRTHEFPQHPHPAGEDSPLTPRVGFDEPGLQPAAGS